MTNHPPLYDFRLYARYDIFHNTDSNIYYIFQVCGLLSDILQHLGMFQILILVSIFHLSCSNGTFYVCSLQVFFVDSNFPIFIRYISLSYLWYKKRSEC